MTLVGAVAVVGIVDSVVVVARSHLMVHMVDIHFVVVEAVAVGSEVVDLITWELVADNLAPLAAFEGIAMPAVVECDKSLEMEVVERIARMQVVAVVDIVSTVCLAC